MTSESIKISVAGYQGADSVHTKGVQAFGKALRARLGDRLQFEVDNNVLDKGHKSGDLLGMVERGVYEMFYISTIRFTEAVPECQFFDLPFVVSDRQKVYQALDGDVGQLLKDKFRAATPFHVMGFFDNGFRHITNRAHPIRSPEDCAGLTIRTQMTPLPGEGLRQLGFNSTQLDIKFLVEQIDGGDFDAQENSLSSTYNFNLHKHHRHITLTGHIFGVAAFLCNQKIYDAWPQDIRDAIEAAALEGTHEQRRLAIAEDEVVLSRLVPSENDVVHLSEAERAKFVEAARPLVDSYREKLGPELFEALL